eukprot:gnl/TRDRNA2_/TRDRNA2_177351_c0_seq1.p1 gnl/TRDRNA2_/TRDRNA2_177351_c0~~gnl/TRDRNA2_/TRDRNA2_177351_c0_seq1.p1  ORF type:complete len:563 (+),score=101.54 gnl/TRDRNA2_/TRDRNA2_177351_c0_seq1:87-1775(+)
MSLTMRRQCECYAAALVLSVLVVSVACTCMSEAETSHSCSDGDSILLQTGVISGRHLSIEALKPGKHGKTKDQNGDHPHFEIGRPINRRIMDLVAKGNFTQPSGGGTTTTHKSWLSKMGNAFALVIVGIILIIASISVMWLNERRAARYECLIKVGEGECSAVDAGEDIDTDKRGRLIHVSGSRAQGKVPVQDNRFSSLEMKEGCLRIRSSVEAFQWVEKKHSETKKDNVGGGDTTETTYTYEQEWVGHTIDSNSFNDKTKFNSLAKKDMQLGTQTSTCSIVHYGKAFQLPLSLLEQLDEFQDASSLVGNTASGFTHSGEYYYYPAVRSGAPQVGDMRAKLEYMPDCVVTVMGLQSKSGSKGGAPLERDSFVPYRLISRGFACFGITKEQQKEMQMKEAEKDSDDLYEQDKCSCGPLNLICCCCLGICNMVVYCMSGLGPPEVYHAFHGSLSSKACWQKIRASAGWQKVIMRMVGWFMLLIGFMMLFEPLFTALDIVPFLGPYLSKAVSAAVFIVALLLTLAIAFLVIALAYLIYHPLTGFMYLLLAATPAAILIIVTQASK